MTSPEIRILISEAQIRERMGSLASDIAAASPKDLLIIALLRGSFVFAADLVRALHHVRVRPQVDFMTISSYGESTTSGTLTVHRDITVDVKGRQVLLIDDILESGRTISHARAEIMRRGAAEVRIAVMLKKQCLMAAPVDADYIGFTIPDQFVVGYGLDYANYYRELPFIGVLENLKPSR